MNEVKSTKWAIENSPAIYRWVGAFLFLHQVREADGRKLSDGSPCRDFCRPFHGLMVSMS